MILFAFISISLLRGEYVGLNRPLNNSSIINNLCFIKEYIILVEQIALKNYLLCAYIFRRSKLESNEDSEPKVNLRTGVRIF